MLLSEFKAEIAALLNRTPQALVQNGVDLVVSAANRGKRGAQRLLDFQSLRASVDLTVNLTNGVDLATARLHGTSTVVEVNRILEVFLQYTDESFMPIEFGTLSQYRKMVMRKLDDRYYDVRQSQQQLLTPLFMPTWPTLFRQANRVFLKPTQSQYFNNQTDVAVGLDAVIWEPDFRTLFTVVAETGLTLNEGTYVPNGASSVQLSQVGYIDDQPAFSHGAGGNFLHFSLVDNRWLYVKAPYDATYGWVSPIGVGNLYSSYTPVGFSSTSSTLQVLAQGLPFSDPSNSIFLTDCVEWLQLYVLQQLQTNFIKATDKWPVTQKMIDNAWRNVVAWNESISEGETSSDLD